MQENKQDLSLGELFADLTRETGTLVRQEVQLAKTEITHKVSQVGKDVASMAAGGAVAYAGFLAIIAAIILGLGSLGIPMWISALLVGLLVTGTGAFLIQKGRSALQKEDIAPRQTLETLKEDVQWAKEQTK